MLCQDSDSAVFYGRSFISSRGVAFIKIDKSLTYRGDKTRDQYQSHKIFPEYEKHQKPPQKTVLEFLESSFRRVVNTLSWKDAKNFWCAHWNTDSNNI
jgi:hypothetical protein